MAHNKAWDICAVVLLSGCQTVDDASGAIGNFISNLAISGSSSSQSTPNFASDSVIKRNSEFKGMVNAVDVIDGDTFRLNGQKIRLYGIDAPELPQTCSQRGMTVSCGVISRNALIGFIAGTEVGCLSSDTDRYGPILARCSAGNFDLSAGMTASGLAVAHRQYSTLFVSQEDRAKARKTGMWKGTFQMPWDWRTQPSH